MTNPLGDFAIGTVTVSADGNEQNGCGKPLYSWRVEILPFPRSWDPSRRWDSEANKKLFGEYRGFAYPFCDPKSGEKAIPDTMVFAITGPGTAFGDGKTAPKSLNDISPSTILAVEVCRSGTPWAAPGDFDIRTMPRTINAAGGKEISSFYGPPCQ